MLLLKKGASVHKLNSKQRSAAHIAAYNSQEEALQEIIKKGADVNHTVLRTHLEIMSEMTYH